MTPDEIQAEIAEWKAAGRAVRVTKVGRDFVVERPGQPDQMVGFWALLRLFWVWSRRGRLVHWGP